MMLGGKTLNVFESNTEDPYIRVPDEKDLSDNEDANITASDFVFCVGTTEEVSFNQTPSASISILFRIRA